MKIYRKIGFSFFNLNSKMISGINFDKNIKQIIKVQVSTIHLIER